MQQYIEHIRNLGRSIFEDGTKLDFQLTRDFSSLDFLDSLRPHSKVAIIDKYRKITVEENLFCQLNSFTNHLHFA